MFCLYYTPTHLYFSSSFSLLPSPFPSLSIPLHALDTLLTVWCTRLLMTTDKTATPIHKSKVDGDQLRKQKNSLCFWPVISETLLQWCLSDTKSKKLEVKEYWLKLVGSSLRKHKWHFVLQDEDMTGFEFTIDLNCSFVLIFAISL